MEVDVYGLTEDKLWDDVSVAMLPLRRSCLEYLAKHPMTPSDIAEFMGKHLSHVSRALRKLKDHRLVKCATPHRNKYRIYRITSQGQTVLEKLEEIDAKR